MNTIDFVFYLLAAICFFLGLLWWPRPSPRPDWPLYLGLLFFVLPFVINSAQHLS